MSLPARKPNRLTEYDYSTPGAYFITLCAEKRANLFGQVVGGGALDAPQVKLSRIGKIVERYILSGNRIPAVTVDKYVIMPNHIHLVLFVAPALEGGTSRAPSPTNAVVPHFISTLKRFCHRDIGKRIFQRSYYDHIIRNEQDYLGIWEYIETNPAKWNEDRFYNEESVTLQEDSL